MKDFNFFRYSTIIVTCLYLVLSFARVDYWVAKVNIDNMEYETQYEFFEGVSLYEDYYYLIYNLSYDAAPLIFAYEDGSDADDYGSFNYEKKEYVQNIKYDTNDMSLRKTNISRLIAKSMAQK